jgi:fructose-1,6-bisphosphatase/sedoheptulose 1,7-bisphosphatase-like protein
MGIDDLKRVYATEDLAPGRKMIFAACGVTDGTLLKGVRFFGGGARTHTLIMTLASRKISFIDTVHLERRPDLKVRF